jgi:hypothetical protein
MLTPGQRRHYQQELRELEGEHKRLTKLVAALDKELGQTLDAERRVVLEERRADRRAQRNEVTARVSQIERLLGESPPPPPDSSDRPLEDSAVERTAPGSPRLLVAVLGVTALAALIALGAIVYDRANTPRTSPTATTPIETITPKPLSASSFGLPPCGPEASLVPEDWLTILSEDFESNRNGWFVGDMGGQDFSHTFSLVNGEYEWIGRWQRQGSYVAFPSEIAPHAASDFFAAVELTMNEGPRTLESGIVFRNQPTAASDYGANLRIGLRDDGNLVQLRGTEGQRSSWPLNSERQTQRKQRLSVMGLGNRVYLWVDQQCAGIWTDSRDPIPTGGIGLYFQLVSGSPATATVRFDNFEVRAP